MPVVNNNLAGIDLPVWEQLPPAPANSAAGACMVDDNERFIYYLISATAFWRYDTWGHTWQQLTNPPAGGVAAGTCMRYVKQVGLQRNGKVFGSIYVFLANGTAAVFYRYNIGDNSWSASLGIGTIPAAFGTDGRLICPEPCLNACLGGYHSAVALNTVTTTAQANAGATTISVSALPLALPIGAVLNFGTHTAPVYAVLTSAAAAAATSISVSALIATVPNAAVAYWYADMFLVGHNATQMYRFNITTSTWSTTSANAGNPALPAVTAAPGAGCVFLWLPGSGDANALNRLILVRGANTPTVYEYDLVANTWSTVTFYPATEGFNTGSASGIRQDASGKQKSFILQKDATLRFYEFKRATQDCEPIVTMYLAASGAALVGDRMSIMRHQGIDFAYFIPSTSSFFVRTALFF